MKAIHVYLTAREPLILSDGSSEGMTHSSLDYIPGNMLRGALAGAWIERHSEDPAASEEFLALFLRGSVFFGHAVPECFGRAASPTPISLKYVKACGSLPSTTDTTVYEEGDGDGPHAINMLCQEENGAGGTGTEGDTGGTGGSVETRKMKPVKSAFVDMETRRVPSVPRIHNIHVTLDAGKRKAAQGMLFGYEAVASGTRFCATICCRDTDASDRIRELLESCGTLRMGHSRSAGYGTVVITRIEEDDVSEKVTVSPGDHTLYLESAFFPEKSWETPQQALETALDRHLPGVTIIPEKTFAREIRMEGFNAIWHMPRASRTGIAAGSVFVIRTETAGTLPVFLGGWLNEGYGRIRLDPPMLAEKKWTPQELPEQADLSQQTDAGTHPAGLPDVRHRAFIRAWQRRTGERLAAEQAIACVYAWKKGSPGSPLQGSPRSGMSGTSDAHGTYGAGASLFDDFFTSLERLGNRPSQSQRGNIRNMLNLLPRDEWIRQFRDTLAKQPGEQWKNARVQDPFSPYRNTLDQVMLTLLDREKTEQGIGAWYAEKSLQSLKGGQALNDQKNRTGGTGEEDLWPVPQALSGLGAADILRFREERHRRLVLEILRHWEKLVREREGVQ